MPYGYASGGGTVLPPGTILDFGGPTPPAGWLECDGSTVSKTTYAALYAAIGDAYAVGGEPTGQFRLPNSKGRVRIGKGTSDEGTTFVRGAKDGEETHTLSVDEMPLHSHQYMASTVESGPDLACGSDYGPCSWGDSTDEVGGDAPHNNMQPYTVVVSIIKT